MARSTDILDRIHIAGFFLFLLFSPFSISLTTIALFIGFPAWVLRHALSQSWNEMRFPLAVPFLLFIAASTIAIFTAHAPAVSAVQAKKFGEPLIVFWTLNTLLSTAPQRVLADLASWLRRRNTESRLATRVSKWASLDSPTLCVIVLGLAAAVSGLVGYYQHFVAVDVYGPRARGPFGSVNTYAQMMMLSGLLLASRELFLKDRRVAAEVALVCVVGGLVWTLSRGAWMGFLIGFCFLLFIRNRRIFFGLVGATVVIVALLPGPMQRSLLNYELDAERNLFLFDQSMQDRVDIWRASVEIFQDHPLTGCGFRCSVEITEHYPHHPILKRFRAAHSNVLQLMVETGAIGLIAWLAIWFFYFKYAFQGFGQVWRNPAPAWPRLGGIAAVLAFHTYGLVESNFFDSEVAMLTYFMMGLSLAAPAASRDPGKTG
ncbi:O-antigen ligase family protein [Nitrospina sp. 32_T5]|uniref:O-antigen ligase family protein n=1 Tax=unclassified Nitrospina TaxID=2638683 RepID=UPI003F9874B1